jgi:hypothetical protein
MKKSALPLTALVLAAACGDGGDKVTGLTPTIGGVASGPSFHHVEAPATGSFGATADQTANTGTLTWSAVMMKQDANCRVRRLPRERLRWFARASSHRL